MPGHTTIEFMLDLISRVANHNATRGKVKFS